MQEGLNPFPGVPVQSHCRSSAFGKAFARIGEVGEVLPFLVCMLPDLFPVEGAQTSAQVKCFIVASPQKGWRQTVCMAGLGF